jgi:hypothetical protein
MKKIIMLLTFCFFLFHLNAQNDRKNQIGTHVAFGTGGYGYFPAKKEGGGSHNTKYYYTIGLDYSRQLSKRLDLCSGFEYTYTDMTATSISAGERLSTKGYLTMATIPVQFKYHFGKLVYLNGGLLLNIVAKEQMNSLWMTGKVEKDNVAMLLGVGLGIGFEHEFTSGITLSLNPYARFNGIGGMGLQSGPLVHYKYLQGGVNLGVGYKF